MKSRETVRSRGRWTEGLLSAVTPTCKAARRAGLADIISVMLGPVSGKDAGEVCVCEE